jgi:hypothetical protein
VNCKFNLIPFNPFPESGLLRSKNPRIKAFAQILLDAGIVTTIRKTRGDDIDAACGQLAGEVQDRTRVQERMEKMANTSRSSVPISARSWRSVPDDRPGAALPVQSVALCAGALLVACASSVPIRP